MARSRNIKPGFFQNELLADIDPLGRLLFAGMWTIADREGRLEDRAKRIKVAVLPYDVCDVEHLLGELEKHNFIRRYQVGEDRFIEIPNFIKHQNPHCKEQGSLIPAPCLPSASTMQEQGKHGTSTEVAQLIPDSLNPITDSLIAVPAGTDAASKTDGTLFPGSNDKLKQPSKKKTKTTLQSFLDACTAAGERAIPDSDPILAYAEKVGINAEMIAACWAEFKAAYLNPSNMNPSKQQTDWRAHFRNAVRKNWYRLWFLKEGEAAQWTTTGEQARRAAA